MATSINLTLTLDASGVLTVANQAGQAIQKIQPPSAKIKQEFDGIEAAETRAHVAGNLAVRLLGVDLPRSMEMAIAKSQTLGPLLSSLFEPTLYATAAVALVGFGKSAVDSIASFSDEVMGNTEAIKKMNAENVQASQDAFWNPKKLEDAQAHLKQIHTEMDSLNATVAKLSALPNIDGAIPEMGVAADPEVLNSQDRLNAAKQAQADIETHIHQLEEANKDLAIAAAPIKLAGQAKINEAGLQGIALNKQQYRDQQALIQAEQAAGGSAVIAAAKSQAAYGEYLNSKISLERDNANQVIALRHQVDEASVQGAQRVGVVENDQIQSVMRLKQQGLISERTMEAEIVLIHKQAADQIIQFENQAAKQHDQALIFADQRAAAFLQGSQKIIADSNIEKEQIQTDLQDVVRTYGDCSVQAEHAWETAQIKLAAIDKATKQQLIINAMELRDKTIDLQQQAAIAALPEWQRSDAQIVLEHEKTYQQLNRLEAQDAGNFQQYELQKQAADALMNAKLIDAHKQMVQQLGSDFASLFDDIASGNIGKRILKNAETLFAEIVAQWVLSLNLMQSTAGGLFGNIVFGPGSTGSNVFGGGNFLGNLFGTSSSNLVPSGSSGFAPSITGFSSTAGFGLPGTVAGGGLAGAIAGTGSTPTFSASNALTTQSMAQISNSTGVFKTGGGAIPLFGSSTNSGGFGSLFGARGLAAAAPLAMMLLGGAGGKVGQIGGLLGGLAMLTSSSLLAGAGGGLLGFGIGSQHGGLLGSLAGAGSGALTGFMVGGPIGALVGGVIGLLGGIFGGIFGGGKRKRQAQQYAADTVIPDIKQITSQFDTFQLDSSSAMQQLEALRTSAQQQLNALKSQGKDVFNKTVGPAIDDAEKHVQGTETERERRAAIIFGAPQFHDGGVVDVMRASIRRQPNEMLAWLKHGERVMNPGASAKHGRTLDAMNAGQSVGGNHYHFHLNAMDAKSFDQWARQGGAQMMTRALNRYLTQEGN
ncbi:MAG TPA: hypothetical protein VJW20_20210 [Candidatus Angelobacter sp.]|nr:hypothetical protein [Candidatus Angelobacter sp.]